jgi:hypothetical protein
MKLVKLVFYLLIFIILSYCLLTTHKVKEKFATTDVPTKPIITSAVYNNNNNSLTIEWTHPPYADNTIVEPINSSIIFIKSQDSNDNGVYMQIANVSDCVNCSYTLSNLNLIYGKTYDCSVLSINVNGVSSPADPVSFIPDAPPTEPPPQTSPPTEAPETVDASVLMPTTAPTTPGIYQMTLEDRIKAGEDARRVYLDNELNNMIIRANGVYEVDSDKLSYPDTYLSDIKESINTVNNMVKKDLQEYRMNVHITTTK